MFESIKEKVNTQLSDLLNKIRIRVLGKNNEHLDFLVDSFYKLSPRDRTLTLGGVILLICFLVFALISLYFSRVNILDRELNNSFLALSKLRSEIVDHKIANENFENWLDLIAKKTSSFKIKPFFEKISKEKKVEIKALDVQDVSASSTDPLYENIKEITIEVRTPKISIPRLLSFIAEVENSGKFIRVKDLKITGMYGNKLYFDTTIGFKAYQMLR